MVVFFDVAYALVVFLALFAAGSMLGLPLGALVRTHLGVLVLPAVALALAGWIWFGWIGGRYGISRLGLVLYSGVGAAGFVRGWLFGLEAGGRLRARIAARAGGTARARCSRTAASRR